MENAVTHLPGMANRTEETGVNVATISNSSGEYEWRVYVLIFQLLTFSVLGSIGNAIVVYIYSNKKEKVTSNIFIISLAIVDLFTCMVVIPFTVIVESLEYKVVYDGFCKMYFFLITSNVPFSMFIMVAIAFDRYFCICHPFLGVMTVKRAKILISTLGLSAIGLGVFTSLMHGMYKKYEVPSDYNTTVGSLEIRTEAYNDTLLFVYEDRLKSSPVPSYTYNYSAECGPNIIIINESTRKAYQKFYSFLFLVSFLIIAVLYALIVRFVVLKRSWRNKTKYTAPTSTTVTQDTVLDENCENNATEATKSGKKETVKNGKDGASKRTQRKHDKVKERTQSSNLKIAGVLFVVTLVFVIAFLPGWLMAHAVLPQNKIVFYMYFMYNVANPAIYAFMNPIFRKDMKKILHCT